MITVKVSVKNKKAADLLRDLLKSLKFVNKVEYETDSTADESTSQIESLKKLFSKKPVAGVFSEVSSPVSWQRKQRDEWN